MDAATKKIYKEYETKKMKFLGKLMSLSHKYLYSIMEEMWQKNGFGDIRIVHLPLLSNIHPDGLNVNALAEKAFTSKQAISQTLKELEEMGYVEIQIDENDKRMKVVKLSDKGIEFMKCMLTCAKKAEKKISSILGNEKMEQLRELQFELVCSIYPNYKNC